LPSPGPRSTGAAGGPSAVAERASAKPRIAHAACLTEDGQRTWGTLDEPTVMDAMMREEFCGRRGRLDGHGQLEVDPAAPPRAP